MTHQLDVRAEQRRMQPEQRTRPLTERSGGCLGVVVQHRVRPLRFLAPESALPEFEKRLAPVARGNRRHYAGSVNLGSAGSTTSRSRSQPSFSSFSVWIATA